MGAFRIVSLTGARQVGKTTLVQRLCRETGRQYVFLEDRIAAVPLGVLL
ncbi:MAG: AAA family ATPase [bacterium]